MSFIKGQESGVRIAVGTGGIAISENFVINVMAYE
jgi:hypothetical protein